MKNQNHPQQEASKGLYVQDTETVETEKVLRGRKKNGLKTPAAGARKSVRKAATAGTGTETAPRRPKAAKNPAARRAVSRFMNESSNFFPRESFNDLPFGHDDFQLRNEMDMDRFSNDDINSAFSVSSVRDLPIELEEEEVQGTYSDQQLIQEIRRAVERDSAVSSAAQKIQLSAKNGVVILKGTVASEQEQMIIEDKAVALAGFGQVVNQLEVIEDIIE
jgi:hypothetical protein